MRKTEVALSLALVTSIGVSLWLWHELQLERRAEIETRQQAAAPAPAEIRIADTKAESPVSAVQQVSPAAPPAASKSAQKPATKVAAPEYDEEALRRMLQDPRYRAAWREELRLNYGLRRENIIRLVGLAPEQADAVIDLQIDRMLEQIEDPRTLNENYQASERAHQAKLSQLLGQEKSTRLQEYMESRASRIHVDEFRNLLGGPETLRDDQVEPLVAALHPEITQLKLDLRESERTAMWSSDTVEAWRQHAERRVEIEKEAHARMHTAAAPVLSSSQLEKFDAMLKRDRERRAAEQRMQGLQSKLGQAPTTAD